MSQWVISAHVLLQMCICYRFLQYARIINVVEKTQALPSQQSVVKFRNVAMGVCISIVLWTIAELIFLAVKGNPDIKNFYPAWYYDIANILNTSFIITVMAYVVHKL